LEHGWIRGPARFRSNRAAAQGGYALAIGDLELHPNVTGDFLQPGLGARLHHEIAAGSLSWQRTELSLSARQYRGPMMLAVHADGGIVTGSRIPPQTLFEMGGSETLPGYSYKEFAGDRAALFRAFASYTTPLWHSPHRVWRNMYVPGLAPGLAAGVQGGWTDISSPAAQAAVAQLTPWSVTPLSRATGGARATAGFGLTLFSGALHAGVARPVDHAAPWRLAIGLGQAF
jgi:hypothetical protein